MKNGYINETYLVPGLVLVMGLYDETRQCVPCTNAPTWISLCAQLMFSKAMHMETVPFCLSASSVTLSGMRKRRVLPHWSAAERASTFVSFDTITSSKLD